MEGVIPFFFSPSCNLSRRTRAETLATQAISHVDPDFFVVIVVCF